MPARHSCDGRRFLALVFAGPLLFAGALGDRFGRRYVLLLGLSVFGLGGLAATTADGVHKLIALRAVMASARR